MSKEVIKCCPMLEKYKIWVDDELDVCFIDIYDSDYSFETLNYKSEPVGYCPFCAKELKTKE